MPVLIFLVLVFVVSLVARRLESTVLTAPMIFAVAGMVVSLLAPVASEGLVEDESVLLLAEITLAILLFTDSTRINVGQFIREASLPARLLGIGMPLTILAGALAAAAVFPGLNLAEAAILATVLAPTDAGLGVAIVNSPRIPVRIREALSVEAGLNDGLSMPFLMLFIAIASEATLGQSWIGYALQQILGGAAVGLAVGFVGGWLIQQAAARHWVDEAFEQVALVSLAIGSYAVAGLVGGNGFIAAFVAGIGVSASRSAAGDRLVPFSDSWGGILAFAVFFLFGMMVGPVLGSTQLPWLLYAVLSLTVIRMLPVAISLIGTRLRPGTVLFLGWFGPRGAASVVLGMIFLAESTETPGEPIIAAVVAVTVLLSILAHGLSAAPGIDLYARAVGEADAEAPAA